MTRKARIPHVVTAAKGGKRYYLVKHSKVDGITLSTNLGEAKRYNIMDSARIITRIGADKHGDFQWGVMPLGPRSTPPKRNPRKRAKAPKRLTIGVMAEYQRRYNLTPGEHSRMLEERAAELRREYGNTPEVRSYLSAAKLAAMVGKRRRNPVPPSSKVKLDQAGELYYQFSGHRPTGSKSRKLRVPTVGLQVGTCDGILYTTVRDGKTEKYVHRFKPSARPLLAASHDGRTLVLVGGRYRFTDRGIVDK